MVPVSLNPSGASFSAVRVAPGSSSTRRCRWAAEASFATYLLLEEPARFKHSTFGGAPAAVLKARCFFRSVSSGVERVPGFAAPAFLGIEVPSH